MTSKLLLLLALTSFIILSAQSRENKKSVIYGLVRDAKTQQPINEVVITLSSATFTGQKFAVTDSAGAYKIPDSAPGAYTLVFEMEGYRKISKPDLLLQDAELAVNVELVKGKDKIYRLVRKM